MRIYSWESTALSEVICGDDFDVAIFLSKEEAEKLRSLLAKPEARYAGPLKDAPFEDKLDLGLEMLGIRRSKK